MILKFTKMQGLGNDFMVVDLIHQSVEFSADKIRQWSDRNFGIGFDQLLVVENSSQSGIDFRYRIFNADGSETQQCGNGARCFARFVYDKGLTKKTEIQVETVSGVIVLYIEDDGLVRINMGIPNFEPASLPFNAPSQQSEYLVEVDGGLIKLGAVSMGNPHVVVLVDDIIRAPVERLGGALESHPLFPERVNVGFAQKINEQNIKLRVHERGVAETLACGTGACAAMVVLRYWGMVADMVSVSLPGGNLSISWGGLMDSPVWMSSTTGVTIFEGELTL